MLHPDQKAEAVVLFMKHHYRPKKDYAFVFMCGLCIFILLMSVHLHMRFINDVNILYKLIVYIFVLTCGFCQNTQEYICIFVTCTVCW